MAAPASSLPPGVHNVHHPNMVVPSMQHVSHAPHRVVSAPPATSTAMLPPNRVAPSNIAPHDSHDLRGRIVEVLSATANGCITELGYWPGMPKRLAEMEQVTKQWQTENVKLYQDNQSLVRTVQSLKEQLQLAAAPDSQRLNKIRQLEGHIQQLAHEKQDLIHRNETLVASVANATQNASQQDMVPVSEYNALMEKCRGLHAENQILRGHLARSGYMVHTPQPSPTVPQQGTPVFISNSPMPPPNQMYVQGPMYTQSRPPPRPHHRTSQSGPVPPPVTIPHPQQPIAYTVS
ncbi:hypothetical protein BDN72DRAFT_407563 [Pluteus cervinus]|uniref:Uncharacterized protein n=1 Tax=Pluteus cervinus TaxID=181527 RepID=A0ACD3B1T3_9AGAR|nr:hypothetical protein BDN72DRAFT_407563 [Pluteus cervinus]